MAEFPVDADRFLRSRFGDRAQNLVPVDSPGEWSSAYYVMLDGRDRVIRFGNYREDFEKDRAMGMHASETVPVPRVLEIGETAEGGYYAVSERVPGKPLDALDGPGIHLVMPQLLDVLHELQTLDLTDTQDVGLWRPDGVGPSWQDFLLFVAEPRERLAGWRDRLDGTPQYARVFDAGVDALRQLSATLPEVLGLVHNDLLNRNVLVDAGRITGVIDWGNAFYGDPLYDIALIQYGWSWYPDWQTIDLQEILIRHWNTHDGVPSHMEERLRCCLIHLGLDHMAYCAFRGRSDDVARHAAQLLTYLQ